MTVANNEPDRPLSMSIASWFRGLFKLSNSKLSSRARYITYLLTGITDIRRELERLPPAPPPLPEELALNEIPLKSREAIIRIIVSNSISGREWRCHGTTN